MALRASDYAKSKYLNANDIKQDKKFRIKAVTEVVFNKEKKPVLWFTNDDRGLVLNWTNIRALAGPFGDDMTGWINKVIVIFPTTTSFRDNDATPALRVRVPPPKQAAAETSGNGAAAATVVNDPDLKPDPAPASADLDSEKPF